MIYINKLFYSIKKEKTSKNDIASMEQIFSILNYYSFPSVTFLELDC